MPFTYQFDEQAKIVSIKVFGDASCQGVIDFFERFSREHPSADNFIEVIDFNEVNDFCIRYSEYKKMVEKIAHRHEFGPKVSIFCFYTEKSRGMAKLLFPLFQDLNTSIQVCNSQQELSEYLDALTE